LGVKKPCKKSLLILNFTLFISLFGRKFTTKNKALGDGHFGCITKFIKKETLGKRKIA
jgi:hypothetical protein